MNILNGLAISLGLLESKCVFKKFMLACCVTRFRKKNYEIMWSSGRGEGGNGPIMWEFQLQTKLIIKPFEFTKQQ